MESPAIQTYLAPQEEERSVRPGGLFRRLADERRELLFWILQTVFWSSIGVVGLLMTRAFQASVPGVGWVILMRMSCGFLQTSALRWIYRRSLFRSRSGFARWPMVIGCCVAMALLEILILQALLVAGISLPGGAETISVKLLVVRLFILAVWSALYFAFHLLEHEHALELRATKAELAARDNELRILQARTGPHFLFNALNGVLACKNDPDAVKDVTRSLADYLRFLLVETRPLEPLSRELDALEKYLNVQTTHFGGKLVCRIQGDRTARTVMVPPVMIQPLFEDAFHHRSESNKLPLQIWLTARTEDDFLRVTVSNTIDPASPDNDPPQGTGIVALNQRLDLLLGPQARVERQTDNGWVRVTIHIPLSAGRA